MSMMRSFRLAVAQFEPVVADTKANLAKIAELATRATKEGAHVVCFQEQAVCGYRFRDPDREKIETIKGDAGRISPAWGVVADWQYEMAEPVPEGPTTQELVRIARENNVVVTAGMHELAESNDVFNAYLLVGPNGLIGRYHKVHLVPGGEHVYFKAGQGFPVHDIGPCMAGTLICYDNHHPEAHRILALKGAHLILMPHVTTGRGLWQQMSIPDAQQQARNWILTWLRARAFDNAVYCAFVNQGSNSGEDALGCSMVVNPDGHVIAQTAKTGEDLAVADIDADLFYTVRRRTHHYQRYRRPELYGPLADPTFGAKWDV